MSHLLLSKRQSDPHRGEVPAPLLARLRFSGVWPALNWRLVFFGAIALSIFVMQAGVASEPDERLRHFEQQIRPLLASKCIKCHGEKKQEGGLRLDSREGILSGGDSGPAVEPGDPAASLLLEAIRYESYEMPPTGQLSEKSIQQFEAWIAGGAAWPADSASLREDAGAITEEDRQWWAFQPLRDVQPPTLHDDSWSRNEIDRFVWKALRERQMRPAPAADKQTLLRRLYFDLIGVPPTRPMRSNAFWRRRVAGRLGEAVDRLLADERYGEHWARYWLDLVRYCESDGWNQDAYRPHIWRYRDYVVRRSTPTNPIRNSSASSSPAMKSRRGPRAPERNRLLTAGIYEYNQRDARVALERHHERDDRRRRGRVSRHEHGLRPLPRSQVRSAPPADYFKLRAFFEPLVWRDDVLVAATSREKAEYRAATGRLGEKTPDVRARSTRCSSPITTGNGSRPPTSFRWTSRRVSTSPVEERTVLGTSDGLSHLTPVRWKKGAVR
jgi:hypothetical protein